MDYEQRGQIDASILIGLHFETFSVPVDGVGKTLLVRVPRFNKYVLVDSATETQHVWIVVLFFLQGFSDHRQSRLTIALFVASIQCKCIQVPKFDNDIIK